MKKIVFNPWIFATIVFFTFVILRFAAPVVFWDLVGVFTNMANVIGQWIK